MPLHLAPLAATLNHRLLYRGALALPDSHLTLDGITFSVPNNKALDTPTKTPGKGGAGLLDNPLALALESMRGRPTLRLLGTVKTKDVYLHPADCEDDAAVVLHAHPCATLTSIYFQNLLCLLPVDSRTGISAYGVKIGLGEGPGDEISEIVIYGKPSSTPGTMHLRVARLLAHPPPRSLLRLPRPDDPTPRRPPPGYIRQLEREEEGARAPKRKRTDSGDGEKERAAETLRRAREVMTGRSLSASSIGASRKPAAAKSKSDGALFKVPSLPRVKLEEDDVFGPSVRVDQSRGEEEYESANKLVIKRLAVAALKDVLLPARRAHPYPTRDPDGGGGEKGNVKDHPEFKDLFGAVYRGVGFAMRKHMKSELLEKDPRKMESVRRLVDTHVGMYADGSGGS